MKASKKIFSLLLGTSMFFTGMPECFAMMADDVQDFTQPLSTGVPSEEAAGDSSGPASPDMTDVDISPLFQDIVPSGGTTSSRPGTAVLLPSEGEGAVQPQIVEDVAADAGTASSEHGSSTSSLADSAAHDAEPEVRHDVPVSDETLRRSALPGTLSGEGERSSDEESGDDSDSSSAASSGSVSPDTSSDEGETSGEVVAPQPQVIREGEPLDGSLDAGPAAGAGTDLSRPGTPTSSLAGRVAREVESDGETSEGASEGEHGSTPLSRSSSRSSDGGEMSDAGSSDDESGSSSAASSGSVSPDTLSDEGETSDDEREEEDVAPPAPLLPPVAPGIIAEAVRISAPGTGKSSFFAKTVDVAVVAHPSLSRDVVTNFISRVWNPTAGKCTVNGTKRKVKFDLIGSDNLNSLKNYRVIIYSLGSNIEQWRSAGDSFLRDIQPINSGASVIFVSVNSDTLASDVVWDMSNRAAELTTVDRKVAYATDADTNMNPTFGFLPFIVRHFDEADSNFSSWTPSQITGAKRGGIAAACVGGAWIAMNKIFKKPNPKKLKKQHKEDKKSEQNQIANV